MSETLENPNVNCLEGMACPSCGSFGPFKIEVTQSGEARVSDDGTDFIEGNVEWDQDSACSCTNCDFSGVVADFKSFDDFQKTVLNSYVGGEFANIKPSEVDTCDDSLLKFLLIELSKAEDCGSIEEAIGRIDTAIEQLTEVRSAFEERL